MIKKKNARIGRKEETKRIKTEAIKKEKNDTSETKMTMLCVVYYHADIVCRMRTMTLVHYIIPFATMFHFLIPLPTLQLTHSQRLSSFTGMKIRHTLSRDMIFEALFGTCSIVLYST